MLDVSISSVFAPLLTAILQCFTWFEQIFSGEWGFIVIGLVTFGIFSRLILAPLFGASLRAGLSDSVRPSKSSDNHIDSKKG